MFLLYLPKRPVSDSLKQGWANFSHEGPDLEKLLKPLAARWLENKVKTFFRDHGPRANVI